MLSFCLCFSLSAFGLLSEPLPPSFSLSLPAPGPSFSVSTSCPLLCAWPAGPPLVRGAAGPQARLPSISQPRSSPLSSRRWVCVSRWVSHDAGGVCVTTGACGQSPPTIGRPSRPSRGPRRDGWWAAEAQPREGLTAPVPMPAVPAEPAAGVGRLPAPSFLSCWLS